MGTGARARARATLARPALGDRRTPVEGQILQTWNRSRLKPVGEGAADGAVSPLGHPPSSRFPTSFARKQS